MDAIKAMEDTVRLASDRSMIGMNSLSYEHIAGMLIEMQKGKCSYGKQCRWLGWAQCAVVASGVADLEDMKNINKRWRVNHG